MVTFIRAMFVRDGFFSFSFFFNPETLGLEELGCGGLKEGRYGAPEGQRKGGPEVECFSGSSISIVFFLSVV